MPGWNSQLQLTYSWARPFKDISLCYKDDMRVFANTIVVAFFLRYFSLIFYIYISNQTEFINTSNQLKFTLIQWLKHFFFFFSLIFFIHIYYIYIKSNWNHRQKYKLKFTLWTLLLNYSHINSNIYSAACDIIFFYFEWCLYVCENSVVITFLLCFFSLIFYIYIYIYIYQIKLK